MKNQRIIIASSGKSTFLMVDGKLYGEGIVKVQFIHDRTEKRDADLFITLDQIPVSEITKEEEKQGFMKMLKEFL